MLVPYRLLKSANAVFEGMLAAVETAERSIRFEMYIYKDCPIGRQFLDAFVRAQKRGVKVSIMVDGWGSYTLEDSFWNPLTALGGEFLRFNPLRLNRLFFRNHRKLMVVDDEVAFIGGCNISTEYCGDGVSCGWCDLGFQVNGRLARELAGSFDVMFTRAASPHVFARLGRAVHRHRIPADDGEIFLNGPGWGRNYLGTSLKTALEKAKRVQIIAAYFLPSRRMRAALMRVARRGGQVQLILAGKSDVPLSQLASRSLYQRLLRAGVEIYEYEPQILHAKLIVIDHHVYVGSANLDTRSFQINYELMVRIENKALAADARVRFGEYLAYSKRIEPATWRKSRTVWSRFKERWAYFLLARVDPYIAQRQLRSLR